MKIGIYDPYLDTLGGGEKYVLDIASFWAKQHSVDIFWDKKQEQTIKNQAKKQFGVNLEKIYFTENIFTSDTSFIKRFFITKKYDVIFFVSDGSIPLLGAKKNIILLQFSVNWVTDQTLKNRIKMHFIQTVICYSEFVKEHIDKTFGIKSIVLPPFIEMAINKKKQKENIILTVGRFTRAMNEKKQLFQIQAFKKLIDTGLKDWKFVLIGSHLPKDANFIIELQKEIGKYPIEIKQNVSREIIIDFYERAKIYWHAAGFGENLLQHPERAEHFGITTVEAMSTGTVPIVFNGGGQKEIVIDAINGFLWDTEEELLYKTKKIIKEPSLWTVLSEAAKKTAENYSEKVFYKQLMTFTQ